LTIFFEPNQLGIKCPILCVDQIHTLSKILIYSSKTVKMQSSIEGVPTNALLEKMSHMTIITQKELELAKVELDEKEILLEELAAISNQKIKEAAKTNRELKTKVEFLQELSKSLDEENKRLQMANKDLEIQKMHYKKIKAKLKSDLENLIVREKTLEIQRTQLLYEVEEKSKKLSQATKMANIGQLSSALVHDLRNPLTVIKSTVELIKLENKNLDEKTSKKITRIENSVKKIAYQIDDVLDFVRESELHLKRVPLSSIIESAISNIIIPSTIKIKKEFREVTINCDARKLEAVFTNLMTNAIQAMQNNGEVKIKILDNGENALIKVFDSGPGISESIMAKMFEPLFTTSETGNGLGLSICKTIVEQHGGTIEVSSPPTVFTLTLPKNLRGYYKASSTSQN